MPYVFPADGKRQKTEMDRAVAGSPDQGGPLFQRQEEIGKVVTKLTKREDRHVFDEEIP